MTVTSSAETIETLREIPKSKGKAAAALVGAYDSACEVVKFIPARTATIEVVCEDGLDVTLGNLSPLMAIEMLHLLVENEEVTHICLNITPENLGE